MIISSEIEECHLNFRILLISPDMWGLEGVLNFETSLGEGFGDGGSSGTSVILLLGPTVEGQQKQHSLIVRTLAPEAQEQIICAVNSIINMSLYNRSVSN